MATTVSNIIWVKDYDGNYVATLPINTIDEVYYDIDKGIKLKDVLKQVVQYIQVNTLADMYKLTTNEVSLGTIVKIIDGGAEYRVVDIDKLNLPEGYEVANGPSVVSPDDPPIEILSYTSDDIQTEENT